MNATAFKQSPHRRAIVRASVQRSRERVKMHQALAKLAYDDRALSMLIRRKYLDEDEAADAAAIDEAFSVLVADLAEADAL
jgi:hypothetical protein